MAKRTLSTETTANVVNKSLSDLTFGQKNRFNYLSSIFDDEDKVISIVKNLDSRGQNNWSAVNDKLNQIANADSVGRRYHNAISNAFEIDGEYSSEEIIRIIGNIRRQLDMPTHVGRLRRHCEEDFFSVFIIHDVITTKSVGKRPSKSDVIAFKPIVSLMQAD